MLIINNPTNNNIKPLRKGLFKNEYSKLNDANRVNKIKPAAAGEGIPTKYLDLFIGRLDKYISVVNLANRNAAQITKNNDIAQPNEIFCEI